ncbi:MAG: NADPH dehydrogenase NamA [Eubacteriales bacterium]|nr:NADPH dehydrogenase NamA [Eubacteriales bacterium]MDD3199987.1 NADPH dehydrogenase NamA [Eubacteriales bacterium]MDD4630190.1 NADPH dehydrogenase NamA [Eubacteriales bacterium]
MTKIFSKYNIGKLELKNRIVMPPMCMYVAPETGMATDWHVVHYATRAVGGAGLLIVEATGVSPEGRISSGDLGIWEDAQIPGLASIVKSVHENGAKIGIQLSHAGRKCEAIGMEIEAPSALPYDDNANTPREMTKNDIAETVEEFKNAAIRADKAGFDLIQIHAAHGYLINEFLSPLTNQRGDEYGGSYENRVRFLGEVLTAIRSVWPEEKPIEVRVTAEDYGEGGNQPADIAAMLNLIKDKGIDSVNVSTGGVISVAPKVFPGYQVPHAEMIKRLTGLPVVAGGLLSDPAEADAIIEQEKADQVYLGRELLRNPYWALHASRVLNADFEWPTPYQRAERKKKA